MLRKIKVLLAQRFINQLEKQIMKKNWKTTAMGVLSIIGAVSAAATKLFDGDPGTGVDLNALMVAILVGVGLIVAKDGDVTGGKRKQ